MPLIFTDAFLATIGSEPAPFEGSLIKRIALSGDPALSDRRHDLEGKMSAYPEPLQEELAGRTRSFDDDESLAAQAELDVHGILRTEFDPIEVEPALAAVGGKTPDFWVERGIAFEVASLFERNVPVEAKIIEALNSEPSKVKVFGLRLHNIPTDKYPKISEARARIRDAFVGYSGAKALDPFHVQTRDGMHITGYLYLGDPAHPTVGGTIGAYGFHEDDPNYRQSVRKRVIQKKYGKYKALANLGFPLILVMHNFNAWLDPEDFDQIFFGDVEYRYDEAADKHTVARRDVTFGPGHYRGLSGALVRSPASAEGYYLVKNPFATVPVDPLEERLSRAFNTRPLPPVNWILRP
jgi:hypothetical protein